MMEAKWTILRSFVDLFAIQLPHGTGTTLNALNAQLEHGCILQTSHAELAQEVAHNATKTHKTPQLLSARVAPKDMQLRTISAVLHAQLLSSSTGPFTNA